MPVPDVIQKLVQRFTDNHADYKQSDYNETQARREFIDPFFTALGWDVDNTQGYAEAYKDVVHEDAIKISGSSRAPDYSFRVGGTRKFFVEAKKPFVNLNTDSDPAFQLRRYAWSAKLPLSILTDFEEFAVYDGRIPPDKDDKPGVARVLYYNYAHYEEKWDEIAALFSREAILKGAFDRFADDKKAKRGTMEVDATFLSQIEGWRNALAQNLARRNPNLSTRDLNFAVQITIDRIIFLRICGDRSIEDSSRLQSLLNGKNVYERMCVQFREADERYNSGLFHFHSEKGRDDAERDTLTLALRIDDDVLKDILKSLYYPAPYAFEVFPADILGQVYEQFLGKVIVLDAKHRAVVEEKPEVRKAGGVYYTPSYIVDYIVKATVGKLLEGKTPRQAADLRFLDPACGSGSFLIGAYQYTLDWHLKWYLADGAEKHAKGRDPKLYLAGTAGYRLTTSERRRILLNNFYGVDIDRQAVEVTKLSLLLKMLEGETQQSIGAQMSLSLGRVLPDLGSNIRCGNSLIAPDFYEGRQMTMLDEEEMYRVNVFDWKQAFPQILGAALPGFDAVIGNPPYIQSRSGQLAEEEKAYYTLCYKTVEYQINTFGLFVEKGLELLRVGGNFGMIIPNYWLATDYDTRLRKMVFNDFQTQEIVNVYKVFANATVDTLLLFASRAANRVFPKSFPVKSIDRTLKTIPDRLLAVQNHQWAFEKEYAVLFQDDLINVSFQSRIDLKAERILGDYVTAKFGMKPYQVGKGTPPQTREILSEKGFDAKTQIDATYLRLLRARNVKRYSLKWESDWIMYGVHLAEPRDLDLFKGARILIQRIVSGKRLDGTYVEDIYICNTDVITLRLKTATLGSLSIKYFTGILMSSLCAYYTKSRNINLDRAAFPKINTNSLLSFPIRELNLDNAEEKKRHDQIVDLVERMLSLNRQLETASPATRSTLQTLRDACDAQIDALVYALYGLSQEEIDIVEGKG